MCSFFCLYLGLSLYFALFFILSHLSIIHLNYICTTIHTYSCNYFIVFMLLKHLHCFIVGAGNLSTGEPASSTHATLIHSLVGSNHLVAACLHTLALDTHRCGVGATGRPINHLLGHKKYVYLILLSQV